MTDPSELGAAIFAGGEDPFQHSVFAAVSQHERAPEPVTLAKRTLIGLSHAIEDECGGHPDAVLFGAFQLGRYYAGSRRRWEALADRATAAFVFALPDQIAAAGAAAPLDPTSPVRLVPLPDDSALLREWSVVIDGSPQPVALAAWELPGQADVPEPERLFSSVWSLRPVVVRAATRALTAAAVYGGAPEAGTIFSALEARGLPEVNELGIADRLYMRSVQYVGRTSRP